MAILEASGCTDTVILHTDQGSVYTSQAYNDLISNSVIIRSMSRAGKPTDNPMNESLNGWIKEELMSDFHLAKSHDVKETLARYIDFYNSKRPAYSLGYMTPRMFYKAFMDGKIGIRIHSAAGSFPRYRSTSRRRWQIRPSLTVSRRN